MSKPPYLILLLVQNDIYLRFLKITKDKYKIDILVQTDIYLTNNHDNI